MNTKILRDESDEEKIIILSRKKTVRSSEKKNFTLDLKREREPSEAKEKQNNYYNANGHFSKHDPFSTNKNQGKKNPK